MKLWAEERKSGTIELILTLPVKVSEVVIGKYLAAWFFIVLALFLTFPIWITVNYLGNPDNGVIMASYIGSFLMSGGYLSIGIFISSLTKNQVIAFIVSVTICFLFTVSGLPIVLDFFSSWAGEAITDVIASFSFLANYSDISRGIIDIRTLVYFLSLIIFFIMFSLSE